jgi:type III secretion protein F
MTVSNINVGNFLSRGMQNVDGMASKLNAKMQEIASSGSEMKQEDLLMLQYEMGQYQAMMTALNNTISSIQGQMKEMAQSIR